ncbi:MAG: hypothetical protein FWC73_06725 [Defluviitaleaceae bacterium]|nr:hypothetical protein [Defluviitaleaceae bacterium]
MDENNSKPKTLITLLTIAIIVLLIIVFRINRRLSHLEANISNMNNNFFNAIHDVRMIQTHIWDLSNRIDALADDITQSTMLSFDHQLQVQSYDADTATAEVLVSFNLREFTPGDMIIISARGSDGQIISEEASASQDGRFSTVMNLPLRDNFALTFATHGSTVITEGIGHIDLQDMLSGRFAFFTNQGTSSGTNQPTRVTLWPQFTNNTQGDPALEVQELVLTLETEDEVIKTWDLISYWHEVSRLESEGLAFTVTAGGDISPDSQNVITRLRITDNLGIEYEQVDFLFLPYWNVHEAWAVAGDPTPQPSFQFGGDWERMGRVLIVE